MGYITGFLTPVKTAQKDEYTALCAKTWPMFQKYGCVAQVENWGVDVPDGKLTSFPMSVKLEEGETVVFSWLVWPDRETADRAWAKLQEDPEMADMAVPFDPKRMMWGGFETLYDSGKA